MMKKVLVFSYNLCPTNGVANCIMQYYDAAIKQGMHIDFLVISDEESAWKEKIKERGHVYVWPKGEKYSRDVLAYLCATIRKNEYSIVHVNVPGEYGAILLYAANKCSVPVRIYHSHNPKANPFSKSWLVSIVFDPVCCKLSNALLACSATAGRSSFGNREFQVLRNCIDADVFRFDVHSRENKRKELGISPELFVIGCVGRLEIQKNPLFALRCIKELRKIRNDFVFVWIGKGSLYEEMQRFIRENEMEEYVILPGVKRNIQEWYSAMDCFFLPSQFEGLGIVFIEAQASGLSCFGSTNVPEDTELTPLMKRISLDQSPQEWADVISQRLVKGDRSEYWREIREAGYDIVCESDRLFQIYSDTLKRKTSEGAE